MSNPAMIAHYNAVEGASTSSRSIAQATDYDLFRALDEVTRGLPDPRTIAGCLSEWCKRHPRGVGGSAHWLSRISNMGKAWQKCERTLYAKGTNRESPDAYALLIPENNVQSRVLWYVAIGFSVPPLVYSRDWRELSV